MEQPPAPPEPRRLGPCASWCLVALGAGVGLAVVVGVGWSPFVRWFGARADARARAHVLALEEELGPLAPPGGSEAGPLFEQLFAGLSFTPAEDEALFRQESWQKQPELYRAPWLPEPDEPDGLIDDAPERYALEEHRALLEGALARLDAHTPLLDQALACDGWSVPPLPYDGGAPDAFGRPDLRRWLDGRGLTRGGAQLWADVVRLTRLAAIVRPPSETGLILTGAETSLSVFAIERALQRAPLDPVTAKQLDERLAALDRKDAPTHVLRAELARLLDEHTPDAAGLARLEAGLGSSSPGELAYPLRLLGYLDNRARWARLQAEAIRAAHALRDDPRAAQDRLQELQAEARAAGAQAIVSYASLPRPRTIETWTEARAMARLGRLALAWTLAAGAGPLPTAGPPLVLSDPLSRPSSPLRWRRDGERAFTVWSVGRDGIDGEAVPPADPADRKPDLVLQVTLP